MRIVPHPRTLRKAREQVKAMVNDGVSRLKIRTYLHRFVLWWTNTSVTWNYDELIKWFIDLCWDKKIATIAIVLLRQYINKSSGESVSIFQAAL